METFETELMSLINKYSKEDESNTPDFILAMFMRGSLEIFNEAIRERVNWYGKDLNSD